MNSIPAKVLDLSGGPSSLTSTLIKVTVGGEESVAEVIGILRDYIRNNFESHIKFKVDSLEILSQFNIKSLRVVDSGVFRVEFERPYATNNYMIVDETVMGKGSNNFSIMAIEPGAVEIRLFQLHPGSSPKSLLINFKGKVN